MRISEGPREKLEKYGIEYLKDEEIIALLIKTGNKEYNVIELSKIIFKEISSLYRLNDYSYKELMNFKGIGKAKSMTIIAALELSKRIKRINSNIQTVKTVREEISVFYDYFINLTKEILVCVYLDTKRHILSKEILFEGTFNSVNINSKEIIKRAIKLNSSYVIIAHNHPSGIETPSDDDEYVVMELETKLNDYNIELTDSIIFTDETYYSMKYSRIVKRIEDVINNLH